MQTFMLDELTGTYNSYDWERLSRSWKLTMYLTVPGTNEPIDKPSVTYHSPLQPSRERSFDEVMEEVLQERAEAWDRLADL